MARLPLSAAALVVVAAALVATPAQAQRQIMVTDDGSGPSIMHVSMPDLATLRQPDYLRSDLPVFDRKLMLDETQQTVVKILLEAYLQTFKSLAEERLPTPQTADGPMFVRFGGGGEEWNGEDGESIDRIVGEAMRGAADAQDVNVDITPAGVAIVVRAGGGPGMGPGGEMPEGAIAVTAEVGGEDGEPGAGVAVALTGPEDLELSEEAMQKLEEAVQAMAERMATFMEENPGGFAAPGEPDAFTMEDHQAHMAEMAERAKAFAKAKTQLGKEFMGDVRSQLTLEQLDRWPDLERTLTRKKTLPKGRLDGEKTDLIELFAALDLDDDQYGAAGDQLDAYELALDDALVRRNGFIDDANDRIDKAIAERKLDRAISIADRASDLRIAVRQVNLGYAESIAQALDDETAEAFRHKVQHNAFPRVHRTTRAQRTFDAAKKLPGLTEDDLAVIGDLETAYRQELERVNQAIVAAILKHQPDEPKRGLEGLREAFENEGGGPGMGFAMHRADDPVHGAHAKRNEVGEKYVKRLHGMLTPEQIDALPKKPTRRQGEPMIIRRSPSQDN